MPRHLPETISKINTRLKTIKQIETALAKFETIAIICILSLMILFSFGQVILRNVFHMGVLWADLFLRQSVLWVGFLGASLAVREGRHISIAILPIIAPKSWKTIFGRVVSLSAAIISAFLTVAAWDFVKSEMASGSTLFLDIPTWIFQTILPYSLGAITVRFLLQTLDPIQQENPHP